MDQPDQPRDFFVSYTQADRAWAEWLAWELEAAGYTTLLQAWDMPAGTAFDHAMDEAVQHTRHTILVLSSAYLRSAMAEAEWRPAFKADPSGEAAVGAYMDAMGIDWADWEDRSAPTGPGPG